MKWRLLLAVITGLSMTDVASFAQGPPDARGPSSASLPTLADGYFASAGIVRFKLAGGRLQLDPPRHRKGSQSRETEGIFESISVTAERGVPSLHYVCHTRDRQLTLSVQDATDLSIESWMPQLPERSVLEQPEQGPIRWTLTRSGESNTYRGRTLLHVRLHEPETFDLHHQHLITHLLRGQSLREMQLRTRQAMVERARTYRGPDAESVADTVERLGNRSRVARMQAERQLMRWGTVVMPILAELDGSSQTLDAEQKARLGQIRRRLAGFREDTAASLASRLMLDRDYWHRIGELLTPEELALANSHLIRCSLAAIESAGASDDQVAASR